MFFFKGETYIKKEILCSLSQRLEIVKKDIVKGKTNSSQVWTIAIVPWPLARTNKV
jgi:hypothetical protein